MEYRILNLITGEMFSKFFSSPYLAEQFKKKAKYSKKIRIVGEFRNEV